MKNQCTRELTGNVILIKKEDFDSTMITKPTSNEAENGNKSKPLLAVVLSEEEKELIYQKERKKYEGSSWEVELDYHKETFISGIEALVEFLNNRK